MSVPPSQHSFRYEPELCSLDEGQTLTEWRRDRDELRRGPQRHRRSLRLRLGAGRAGGARASSR